MRGQFHPGGEDVCEMFKAQGSRNVRLQGDIRKGGQKMNAFLLFSP